MRSIRSILRAGGMLVLTAMPLCAIIDLDGDGISDVWTARYGRTTATDADPDGDGATNQEEANAGTNPTDPKDHLAATLWANAEDKLMLSWPSVLGKRYRIENSSDLRTWTDLGSRFTGTGDRLTETLGETASATSQHFWRVAVDDADTDSDGISDWEEAQLRTNPANPDTDGDGMVDSDEYRWFGGFSYDGTGDSDGDGINDVTELANGTSPYDPYNGTAPPAPPAGFTDSIPPTGNSTILAPTSWCFFILPDDYELVAKSVSGVAVLKRPSSNDGLIRATLFRWDMGSIDELGESDSAVINRRGTIAMRRDIRVSPYQSIPAASIFPRTQTTPWTYIPPFVSASGYNWWYEEYWSTRWNHIDLIAIDDNNTIWYETIGGYDDSHGYYYNAAATPYGGGQEIHPQFLRYGATDNGSHYFGISVSASGTPYGMEIIGDYPCTYVRYIGDRVVEDLPYINENETRLWHDRAEIEFADGHTEPTPTDGTVWYLDSSDRPHGEAGGRNVMWTKRSATSDIPSSPVEYTRHDYVALPSMNGWVTDIMVAPDSDEPVSGTATHPTLGTHNFLAFPVHAYLALDANRDGEIKLPSEDDSDATSSDKPSRFWINDDNDASTTPGDAGSEVVGSTTKDWWRNAAGCQRDLEDFARLWISTQGLNEAFQRGDMFLGLKWEVTSGAPAIKVFPAVETDGGTAYLTDGSSGGVAEQQSQQYALIDERYAGEDANNSTHTTVGGTDVFVLPKKLFENLSETQPKTFLLFEGCGVGKGQLKLVILDKNKQVIGEGPCVWMDLKNIKSMYERVKATADGAENFPFPYNFVGSDAVPSPAMGWASDPSGYSFEPASDERSSYIVFVHGWNMEYAASTNYAETMFKRMWQRGYKGRFVSFRWPTFTGLTTFNDSEYRAWKCGVSLKQYIATLPTSFTVNLVAHSMGNIVAGSALEKGASVANYALLNAAVPAICYDTTGTVVQTSWGYITPNDDPDPATVALSYQGRLAGVSGNLVNFFLPADSALSAWELNNDSPDGGRFPLVGSKPHQRPEGSIDHAGYGYQRTAVAGQKLRVVRVAGNRFLSLPDEAMAFAVQAPSLTVGADGRTRGSITGWVDLSAYGFDSVHSAEFLFTIQQTRNFYGTVLLKLGVAVQP